MIMQSHNKINSEKKNLSLYPCFLMIVALIAPFFIIQGCSPNTEKSKTSENPEQSSQAARLVVDTNTYDFGTISMGAIKKGVFNLSNAGDKTLLIKEIDKCCGAVISIDKNEIQPGQTVLLTAEYHASQGPGLFSKNITVHTNDPQNSEKTLTIKGTVIQTLEWSPKDFAIATFQHTDIPEIVIKSLDNKLFSIKKFASTNDSFKADFDPGVKAAEFTLKPQADLDKLKTIKTSTGVISIELDHPDYPVISLSFQLIKPLQVSPSQIVATRVRKGEPVEKTLEIHDNSAPANENIFDKIELITASKSTKVEMLKHDNLGNTCKIYLKITPSEDESKQAETLLRDEVLIKMKDGRQLNVPVRIYYE